MRALLPAIPAFVVLWFVIVWLGAIAFTIYSIVKAPEDKNHR